MRSSLKRREGEGEALTAFKRDLRPAMGIRRGSIDGREGYYWRSGGNNDGIGFGTVGGARSGLVDSEGLHGWEGHLSFSFLRLAALTIVNRK